MNRSQRQNFDYAKGFLEEALQKFDTVFTELRRRGEVTLIWELLMQRLREAYEFVRIITKLEGS